MATRFLITGGWIGVVAITYAAGFVPQQVSRRLLGQQLPQRTPLNLILEDQVQVLMAVRDNVEVPTFANTGYLQAEQSSPIPGAVPRRRVAAYTAAIIRNEGLDELLALNRLYGPAGQPIGPQPPIEEQLRQRSAIPVELAIPTKPAFIGGKDGKKLGLDAVYPNMSFRDGTHFAVGVLAVQLVANASTDQQQSQAPFELAIANQASTAPGSNAQEILTTVAYSVAP